MLAAHCSDLRMSRTNILLGGFKRDVMQTDCWGLFPRTTHLFILERLSFSFRAAFCSLYIIVQSIAFLGCSAFLALCWNLKTPRCGIAQKSDS